MSTNKDIQKEHLVDYAFGLTKDAETQAIEDALNQQPELQQELDEIISSLGAYAEAESPAVPGHLKDSIKAQLTFADEAIKPHSKTIALDPSPKTSEDVGGSWKWYAVAASVALIVSLTYNVMLGDELKSAKQTIVGLQQNATEMAQQGEVLQTNYQTVAHYLDVVTHEKSHMVRMMGTDYMPNAMATVVWNEQTQEVMVDVNRMDKAPQDHQMQLWALVDGQPVDLGVFDITNDNEMLKMKSIEKADAFAVTVEQMGGSPTPHLERLAVIGNL